MQDANPEVSLGFKPFTKTCIAYMENNYCIQLFGLAITNEMLEVTFFNR